MELSDEQQSVNLFSSKLKQNIIYQAASMLLQHVTLKKNFYHVTQNNNGNALDERRYFRRMNKCNSWLAKSDTSLNRVPIFLPMKFSRRFHSSNASSNIQPPIEEFSSPLMLIQKKRLRRDYFLSTMQNCIQPPYSQNHFYAFDQYNLLKLQRNTCLNFKRKYSEVDDDYPEIDLISSKKLIDSPLQTADHITINKYHDEIEKPESEMILSRLEKILNLCEELRTLANDVENHLHEKQTNLLEMENTEPEQTIIDIYKELEIEEVINEIDEKNAPLPYQTTTDTSSIHSESNQSHLLMQTESFKTKSNSQTILRKPEDICSCFLKSIFEKDNCQLNFDEQEYLNQLTKAYLLGREQILREQHEQNKKFQLFLDENLPDEPNQFDTNNNNQSIGISPNFEQSTISSEMITAKHQVFINEPIAMKTTNVLPGIGVKYAQQLAECGFSTVRRLLGFYLMIKNDQNFVDWLNTKPQISIHSAWLCTKALRAWCQIYL